jgi:cell division septum initiation protein DivIVA
MNVYDSLDQIEQIINSARKFPFSNKVLIDREEILEHIDRLRLSLPEEIREARRVKEEREELMQKAQKEAESMLVQTEEMARRLVDETKIMEEAEAKAQKIIQQTQEEADQIKMEAYRYAIQVLNSFESKLNEVLESVHQGLDELGRQINEEE